MKTRLDGWLLIDKPEGITSFDVIKKIRNALKFRGRIGHSGTLDPFASGILLVGMGNATKLMEYTTLHDKCYEFDVYWGEGRNTGDITGNVNAKSDIIPNLNEVEEKIRNEFMGPIKQKPHCFSAVKVNGKRCYSLARKNIDVSIPEKDVSIYSVDYLPSHENPNIGHFKIHCSKGFYIRSFVEDIAKSLNTCAYVKKLRRTGLYIFRVENAVRLDDFIARYSDDIESELCNDDIMPMHIPVQHMEFYEISRDDMIDLQYGRSFLINEIFLNNHKNGKTLSQNGKTLPQIQKVECAEDVEQVKETVLLVYQNDIVGIGRRDNNVIKPQKVFGQMNAMNIEDE